MNWYRKILLGALISYSAIIAKVAYEYGRYSAIHQVYKRGWTICEDDPKEAKHQDNAS